MPSSLRKTDRFRVLCPPESASSGRFARRTVWRCQHQRVTEFDAETALAVGGWDARFARVIDVQVDGDAAAALVDANGDGQDLNIGVYTSAVTTASGWRS